MPLKIAYLAQSRNQNMPGKVLSAESLTISGTSAQSAATPSNADYIKVTATETSCFEYSSANPTASATTSAYLAAGETIYLDAVSGYKVAGITA